MKKEISCIYGPVSSWRLGRSLGIDLLGGGPKVCSFDCCYCQLGPRKGYSLKRRVYVPTKKVVSELLALPQTPIDFITFSGCGEPTLAKNLGRAIRAVKRLRPEPVAVLTNSGLLAQRQVRRELMLADLVALKLDADSEEIFRLVNRPAKALKLKEIIRGIKRFRREYSGTLALQIMFTEKNKSRAKQIARLARQLNPDWVQIGTPTRGSGCGTLTRGQLLQIKRHFKGLAVICLYDVRRKKVQPLNLEQTLMRRPRRRG